MNNNQGQESAAVRRANLHFRKETQAREGAEDWNAYNEEVDATRQRLDIGRVYLPEEDRRRFGYDDEALGARLYNPAFIEMMRFEVERTRELFYRGYPLVERMPAAMRGDVELFIEGGLAILDKIERQRFNVWARRPALAAWEKGLLLAGAVWRRLRAGLRVG